MSFREISKRFVVITLYAIFEEINQVIDPYDFEFAAPTTQRRRRS